MKEDFDPGKDFAHAAADLTDSEVADVFRVIFEVRSRYANKPNNPDNLNALRDEVLTKLMDRNILATLDVTPCFYGEPPSVEILGKIAGDSMEKYGFDHDLKTHEVRTANKRGEDWLGQKEDPNPISKAKKRERNRKEKMRKLQSDESS